MEDRNDEVDYSFFQWMLIIVIILTLEFVSSLE